MSSSEGGARSCADPVRAGFVCGWNRAVAVLVVRGLLLVSATTAAACSDSTEPEAVASLRVAPAAAERVVGQTLQLSAEALDRSGRVLPARSVEWTSSGSAIASVDATGLVRMLSPGTAIVTVRCEGMTASVVITVRPVPVASVEVTPATLSLLPGDAAQFTALLRDSAGGSITDRPVEWRSTVEAFARVSTEGLVTAVAPGTAEIQAISEGRSGSATVLVSDPCDPSGARPVELGRSISGSLSAGDCTMGRLWYDLYRLTVTTAATVQLDLRSTAFDALLYLLDGIAVMDVDDDSGGGTNARIVHALTPGTYYLVVTSFWYDESGPYTLTLTTSPGAEPAADAGTSATAAKASRSPMRFPWIR